MSNSDEQDVSFLKKQAWDYFVVHASQRNIVFNFYIFLSAAIATTYSSSFNLDSHLASARPMLAFLELWLTFIFWKLDQRTKFLVKNSEDALKCFESRIATDIVCKVFSHEEQAREECKLRWWEKWKFWRWHMTYSHCFNSVFLVFACMSSIALFPSASVKIWSVLLKFLSVARKFL